MKIIIIIANYHQVCESRNTCPSNISTYTICADKGKEGFDLSRNSSHASLSQVESPDGTNVVVESLR